MTQPQTALPGTKDPGQTLGIVGLILSFFLSLVGLIISIIGLTKSRKAGFTNIPAIIGIAVGALATVIYSIVFAVIITSAITTATALAEKCAELGPGVHEVGGYTYRCN